jgi:hypothetical protein
MNSTPLTSLRVSRCSGVLHTAQVMLATSVLGCIALFSAGAHAQQPQGDPPGRVARLSEINGQVWLYNPDGNEWVAASRNRPLTSGDRVATDPGARAELQVGSSTLRIDGSTELEVVQLDDDHVALQLHDGSAIAHVRDFAGAGQLTLSTSEGRFIALSTGTYRFDRNNGRSDVTVYAGQARYDGQNSALPVSAGQRAEFWIDSGGVAQYSLLAPVNDAFSGWSGDRDRRVAGSIGQRYVSPEMTGAAELDAYGRWEPNADYGSVWIPTAVAADWAPYSHGHWAWVRPWGWTWVDDAPWGFAPFHYGRWVYLRNNWCWTPGTRVARPVYAPALVAWVGSPRGNVSITIGGGPAVGWLPLAPREVYVPSYRVSPRYVQNVNITNVTNVTVINNVYNNPQGPREFENRRAPRGVTVVPANVMAERRPVAPAAAEFRQSPAAREFVNAPGRQTALLSPQVAAPVVVTRNPDPRAVRPPPGAVAGAGDRSGFVGRPGGDGRERGDRGRGPDGRETERPGAPPALGGQRPGSALPPLAGAAPVAPPNAAAPAVPAAVAPPAAVGGRSPSPPDAGNRRPEGFVGGPERSGRFRERDGGGNGGVTNGAPPAAAPITIGPAAAVAPPPRAAVGTPQLQPQPQPQLQPQQAQPQQPQQAPMMRPLPVHRDDDRRSDERRAPQPPRGELQPAPEGRRMMPPLPQQQPQQQVMPMQQPQPRVERVAPPRPVEVPRPVEMQRPAPPVAQPAPPAAPVQRIEPRQEPQRFQGRTDNRGDEPRRGDPREGR